MDLEAYRETLLRAAAIGVKKWCCAPEQLVDGRRRSDAHWVVRFGGLDQQAVTADDAHRFLASFQLAKMVAWDKPGVAGVVMDLRDREDFDPQVDIPNLSQVLAGLCARRQQTSAASKIATFAKPRAHVYIWDRLASMSARYRDWSRGGRVGRLKRTALYRTGSDHDYPAFYAACDRALKDERDRSDFRAAFAGLVEHFRSATGPMADSEIVDDGFIERRLLDKLMFAEGWVLDRKLPPPDSWTSGDGM